MTPTELRTLAADHGAIRADVWRVSAALESAAGEIERLTFQPRPGGTLTCTWNQEDDGSEYWGSSCRFRFALTDGTPTENGMKICCNCGKPLVSEQWVEPEDEDEA